jgi:hypothetical protein
MPECRLLGCDAIILRVHLADVTASCTRVGLHEMYHHL